MYARRSAQRHLHAEVELCPWLVLMVARQKRELGAAFMEAGLAQRAGRGAGGDVRETTRWSLAVG